MKRTIKWINKTETVKTETSITKKSYKCRIEQIENVPNKKFKWLSLLGFVINLFITAMEHEYK